MPEQVPFINREKELALIDKLIGEWGNLGILCINADGGIGKTRLLQKVRDQYTSEKQAHLIMTEMLDFDDRTLHVSENVGTKIAHMLDETIFEPYLRVVMDYHKMERAGVSYERLIQTLEEGNSTFVECFHRLSEQKRIVLLLDTTDAVKEIDFWEYLVKISAQMNNTVILIAGRNARVIGKTLQSRLGEDIVRIIDLPPFQERAGETYLQQKQALLYIELKSELRQKLLLLAEGKPILIDLAVEWLARNIPLDWLVSSSLEELQSLPADELKEREHEFERQLVLHIAQMRSQIDHLIVWMSQIYPLDVKMIAMFLNISEQEAETLSKEAQSYVFVKHLPDGRITLHDEMRRMINEYVWVEVDPKGDRQRRDSKLVIKYLDRKIRVLTQEVEQLEKEEKVAEEQKDVKTALDAFAKRVALEHEEWILRTEHLKHTLFVDIPQGVKAFVETFDEATKKNQFALRDRLLVQMQSYADKLSVEQRYELDSRRVQYWYLRSKSEYDQARELTTQILKEGDISPEKQVNILISRANAEIRLGHVKKGISDFEKAVKISKKDRLLIWRIKALNGLGWGHRLIGNVDQARKYYEEAQHLCLKEGGPDKEELRDDYGWISNNLAFVLSERNETRRTAINTARSAIEYWQSIGNDIGLGAGYLVLGIAYYRNDISDKGLGAFQKALEIFEPLKYNDWLGQIYSWRGALYQDMEDLTKAEEDLKKSLDVGSPNIEAMTRNRLGRVYMSQGRWDLAEEYIKKSLECAQQIPDYRYWLSSVARLTHIAAAKGEYQRLDEFNQMLQDCLSKIKNRTKNNLGVAYLGLAKLALGQNDPSKIDRIVEFLKQGIPLVTEFGSYARTDILSRLATVEKYFQKINPEIIRSIGKALLQEYTSEKWTKKVDYNTVGLRMYKWANWKEKEVTNE
jgi:tetratricopeptide (TPR) repeat protein